MQKYLIYLLYYRRPNRAIDKIRLTKYYDFTNNTNEIISMKKTITRNLFALCCFALTMSAEAVTIVDTGSAISGGISLGNNQMFQQSLGVGFSVSDSYNITNVSSYFYAIDKGTLTASLYSSKEGLPNVSLYSQQFEISTLERSWAGISDLNWMVLAGDYWLTYEVLEGQTFNGAMDFPTTNPLELVVKNNFYTEWTAIGNNSFALVISGDLLSPVPAPAALPLMASALGVLGFVRRHYKSNINN